jgi:preprotein translocase subunit SecA
MLEHLRQVIGLRGYGQRDPLNEYKQEAFHLFEAMIQQLREGVTAQLMRVEIMQAPPPEPPPENLPYMEAHHINPATGEDEMAMSDGTVAAMARSAGASLSRNAAATLTRNPNDPSTWGKVGRNEVCPCGSGKKFKHCHGRFS